jgi:hypothetical protein
MAAGDVEVRVSDATTAAIDTALTAMRATAGANGHYGMCSIQNEQKVVLFAVTEA